MPFMTRPDHFFGYDLTGKSYTFRNLYLNNVRYPVQQQCRLLFSVLSVCVCMCVCVSAQ